MSTQSPSPKPYQYVCVVGCVIFVQNVAEMEDHEFTHANNLRSMAVYAKHLIDDENHHHQLLMRIYARRKLIKAKSPDFIDQFRYPVDLTHTTPTDSTDSNSPQIPLAA